MRSATPSSGATTMPARSVTTRHDRLHIRGAGPRTLVTRDLPIAITRGRNRSRFITLFRARRRLSPHRRSRRLPQARAGAFASDIGSNCSVHPRYDDRIRLPVSSRISLTHAPLHHVQLHRALACRMRLVISCIVLTTSGWSGWPGPKRTHDVFRRQQRQKTQNDNAAPGQQTKGSSEETRAHYRRIFLYIDLLP